MSRNDWGYRSHGRGGPDRYDRGRWYGEFDSWGRGGGVDSLHPGDRHGSQRGYGQGSFDRGRPEGSPFYPPYQRYGREAESSGWRNDDEVRQAVRQALVEDRWLDSSRIEVNVKDGVVTLSGQVAGHLEARYAWDDAWDARGVEGVINRLAVLEGTEAPTEPTG
jgi:hypothetical protein